MFFVTHLNMAPVPINALPVIRNVLTWIFTIFSHDI
jgi:hypothetical protein